MTDGKKEKWNFETDFDTFRQKNLLSMFVEKHYNFIEKKKNEGFSLSDIFEVAEGMGLLKGFSAKQFENKFSYLRGKKTEPSDEKNGEKKKKTNKKKNKDSTPAVEFAENAPNVAENPAENAENLAENPPISAENPAENVENPAENSPSLPENPPSATENPQFNYAPAESDDSAKKKYTKAELVERIEVLCFSKYMNVDNQGILHAALNSLDFPVLCQICELIEQKRISDEQRFKGLLSSILSLLSRARLFPQQAGLVLKAIFDGQKMPVDEWRHIKNSITPDLAKCVENAVYKTSNVLIAFKPE